MSAQAPAVVPGIDNKHDINGVEDIEHDVKGETDTRGVIVTEADVRPTVAPQVKLTGQNKRIRRKTDKYLLSLLVWVYFLQIYDKTVFGYGK